MTNMSYCRFRNTLGDMQDCWNQIEALLDQDPTEFDKIDDQEERHARMLLIELCLDVAARFRDEGVDEDNDTRDTRDAIVSVLREAEEQMPAAEQEEE